MARTEYANRDAVVWCRRMRGMSQEALAEEAGIDVRTVRKMEAGHAVFQNTLLCVAAALKVDADLLIASLSTAPRSYPKKIRSLVKEAQKAEVECDFEKAMQQFSEALQECDACNPDQKDELQQRVVVNMELRDAQRRAYKGTPDDRIWYWDESGTVRFAPKQEVHAQGLPHPTVILLFRTASGRCAWYERAQSQQYGCRRDFFGGHMLHQDGSPLAAAIREANEEFRLFVGNVRIPIKRPWLKQIGPKYGFEWESSENREWSTVYVVSLPSHPALTAIAVDEDASGSRVINIPVIRYDHFHSLVRDYERAPSSFADGAARVLTMYARNRRIQTQLDQYFQ